MILIVTLLSLFLISVISNYRARSLSVKLYLNNFEHLSYHLGISSSKFMSKDPANPHTLSIISIGLLIADIEFHFITKINLEETE